MKIIECNNLVKEYKLSKKQIKQNKSDQKVKRAVDRASFAVERGSIFGLLGPNGAGKTTIQRVISTLIKPTSGEVFVDGLEVSDNSLAIRNKICFLTGEMELDKELTPEYLTLFYGRLYGLSDDQIKVRRDNLFNELDMNDFRATKVGNLSTGMKQKVSIAISLINDPEIIIYDEPTNGLDIIASNVVVQYIRELNKQGKTIILSTHIFSIIEELCDDLAILIDGKIIFEGKLDEVLAEYKNVKSLFFDLYGER